MNPATTLAVVVGLPAVAASLWLARDDRTHPLAPGTRGGPNVQRAGEMAVAGLDDGPAGARLRGGLDTPIGRADDLGIPACPAAMRGCAGDARSPGLDEARDIPGAKYPFRGVNDRASEFGNRTWEEVWPGCHVRPCGRPLSAPHRHSTHSEGQQAWPPAIRCSDTGDPV